MIVDAHQGMHILRTLAARDEQERRALAKGLYKCLGRDSHLGVGNDVDTTTQTDLVHGGGQFTPDI